MELIKDVEKKTGESLFFQKINVYRVYRLMLRELSSYFFSPIAYVVIVAFWIFSGFFFWMSFFVAGFVSLRSYFAVLPWMLVFIVPAVTMRLFSEEKSVGSYELLVTFPITFLEIILAKFFSACVFCFFMLLLVPLYGFSLSFLGDLDWGPVMGGFFGGFLLSVFYASIGLYASSVSKNQIVAFLVGLVLCMSFFIFDKFLFFLPVFFLSSIRYISSNYHFQAIARGVLDSRDLGFFLGGIVLFLFFTHCVIKRQFEGS